MPAMHRSRFFVPVCTLVALLAAGSARGATPSVEQALRLAPIQQGTEYDQPTSTEAAKCTIKVEKEQGRVGWVVRGPNQEMLRMFTDSNGDNVVDRWSYFKDGLEVYRDIDSDYNGKADQYRWFHTGGTRWGKDDDEDGKIDSWRVISAEEVTAEVVEALKSRDAKRFSRLLLTGDELKSLGLGDQQAAALAKKVNAAANRFDELANGQRKIGIRTKFVNFGGTRPGIVPAGTAGSKKDLMVYENVVVLIETEKKNDQIHVGTIVRVGNTWRLIDTPEIVGQQEVAASGYFFRASLTNRPESNTSAQTAGASEQLQKVMAQLEQLESQIATAGAPQQAALNTKRADMLERLVAESTDDQHRKQWVRQMADTISAAVQTGGFPNGIKRLEHLEAQLAKQSEGKELQAYVKFRRLSAAYSQDLQQPKADFAKIQEQWLKDLESFVKAFPTSADSAEAMLQIAIAEEFAGEEDAAKKWYGRIVQQFADSMPARKAAGAMRRLGSVGKTIELAGPSTSGKSVDLTKYRGKVVLVQYWATWCEPCKADIVQIKDLVAKYGNRGFAVIGVNLDNSRSDLVEYLKSNRLPWFQIYEQGGLENRLANEMGILTLPTMLLIDDRGRVINRGIHIGEVETELKKLLK